MEIVDAQISLSASMFDGKSTTKTLEHGVIVKQHSLELFMSRELNQNVEPKPLKQNPVLNPGRRSFLGFLLELLPFASTSTFMRQNSKGVRGVRKKLREPGGAKRYSHQYKGAFSSRFFHFIIFERY